MIDKCRLACEDRATASTRNLFVFRLSEEVCNILGKMTNCVMTTKTSFCEAFIVTSCARTGNLFHTDLRLLGMLGNNVIVQSLFRCRLVRAVLTLMFQSTVMIRLVVHVHCRLLSSYKGAVRTDILAVSGFLIYVHHGGLIIIQHGLFQFLEMALFRCADALFLLEKLNCQQKQMACPRNALQ